ncbi:MAG: diacylglycerol kinase family protein [Pseudomonadota bacterium]
MTAPPLRIVVLSNPAASGHRGEAEAAPPGLRRLVLEGPARLPAQYAEAVRDGCDLVVIDGGDGTVRQAAGAMLEAPGEPPAIAILARGNSNLVARRFGGLSTLEELRGLDRAELARRAIPRPVMRVERDGAAPEHGFILGWGAYAAGTRIAQAEIAERGAGGVWRGVLSTLRRALFGAEARALRAGAAARIRVDGAPLPDGPRFVGLATVLPMPLFPGLAPVWGEGAGPLGWLDVAAPPKRLWLAAPLALLGRPTAWMKAAGHRSGRARALELRVEGGLVLDGDALDPRGHETLRVTADRRLRFLAGGGAFAGASTPPVVPAPRNGL